MFYKPYLPNKTPEPPSKCAARTRTPRPMTSTGSFCLPILIASELDNYTPEPGPSTMAPPKWKALSQFTQLIPSLLLP